MLNKIVDKLSTPRTEYMILYENDAGDRFVQKMDEIKEEIRFNGDGYYMRNTNECPPGESEEYWVAVRTTSEAADENV